MQRFHTLLTSELRYLLGDKAVLISIFGGILFYAALYPQPYLNDKPREQAIAIIDLDQSAQSRKLSRWADASQDVTVVQRLGSVAEARQHLIRGDIRGMLVIPRHFERDLRLNRSPTVAIAADTSYFLVYGTVLEGLVGAVTGIGATHKIAEILTAGTSLSIARDKWTSLRINERPLFNVNMGYLGYVIPAVFIMILQQTLLLAGGLLGAGQNESRYVQNSAQIFARFAVLFVIYFLLTAFYVGACFQFYGVVRVAGINDLALMMTAFVGAAAAMAVFLGTVFARRELAAPVVMASSLPLVFCAGFVWPLESIPEAIRAASLLAPTTSAVQGFLKLNQMGASFSQVFLHWAVLLALSVCYLSAALLINHRRRVSYTQATA